MARRKKPLNETTEQSVERKLFEDISNQSTRSEKTAWNRKMDNMVKLLARIRPLEEQILDLTAQKAPLLDEVVELRKTMVNECVHPYEQLVQRDGYVECKFCGRKIRVNASETS